MKITAELIDYIGALSRLSLTETEREERKNDLEDILNYMEALEKVDTEGAREMTHPFEENNSFREDIITNEDRREEMLANAPEKKDGFFKVFKAVEG